MYSTRRKCSNTFPARYTTVSYTHLDVYKRQVYYLNGELSPKELKELGAAGLDYHMGVIKKHPEWIKEAHDLGLKVNVWTVDEVEDMKWLIEDVYKRQV